ncbi:hypothetical protein DICPUDRAFT_147819 [Dictyostelium purpureum]|uniref:Thioredoxin domain-containing protein n=1 Tax=Dictyostelium purpureum TaxID=5786 RepID=F0Z9H7_DICPU|nr:uncharacterized protein DICPUDRAFT_147819 [Dictyostelium purpureum]EGC39385.1 hypothetical protein DICPUDRAFT_147819 [Dictyostelium purpureum]|eukprot:XP_003284059.1 hypothetical protein DICPUDRAFT_147819 [Dictyostelium purpureum]
MCNKFEKSIFPKCAQENPNISFIIVNIDKLYDLPQAKTVSSLPFFKAYKNQNQIAEYAGSDENRFEELVLTLKSS